MWPPWGNFFGPCAMQLPIRMPHNVTVAVLNRIGDQSSTHKLERDGMHGCERTGSESKTKTSVISLYGVCVKPEYCRTFL